MKNEIKFWLVNIEGCVMDDVSTDTFRNARKYFEAQFGGKYKIQWTDKYGQQNEKNVRL